MLKLNLDNNFNQRLVDKLLCYENSLRVAEVAWSDVRPSYLRLARLRPPPSRYSDTNRLRGRW